MKCRHCKNNLEYIFLDLGHTPPANAYLSKDELQKPELTFPLRIYVCDSCWLVQTEDYLKPEDLFCDDYAYFSSTSKTWLEHAHQYSEMIKTRLSLSKNDFIIEIASNDGYLLKNFVAMGIPCLGIEPTESTARVSEKNNIPVLQEFFGLKTANYLATKDKCADLICGNNVYAHVPDINNFTQGLSIVLKKNGTINLEFPHLMRLIEKNQFDTVYHEHFSYLSLTTVCGIFSKANLRIYDVEELYTHGGSLRVYGCHKNDSNKDTNQSVFNMLEKEKYSGLLDLNLYKNFQKKINKIKNDFLMFLIDQKRTEKSVVAYGAAAKGNTLLNYAGIKSDLIQFICDAAPSKQGYFLPGSHIPIISPDKLSKKKPDWIVILPWNISSEIIEQQKHLLSQGGKFVTVVPELKIYS